MGNFVGAEGEVEMDDASDNTSKVCFAALKVTAWLPTAVLLSCGDRGSTPGRRPSASAPAVAAGTPAGSRAGRSSLPGSRPRSDPPTVNNGVRRSLVPRPLGASMGIGQAPAVSAQLA